MSGSIRRPEVQAASSDAFSFGVNDAHAQGLRNLMVMATLPWTAMFAMQAEIAEEAVRRVTR
ncbi:MAG: hypothetical protein AAGI51_12820 [Pseudomonadota bacterium]